MPSPLDPSALQAFRREVCRVAARRALRALLAAGLAVSVLEPA